MSSYLLFSLLTVLMAAACHGFEGDKPDATGCPTVFAERCSCGIGSYRNMFPDRQVYITNCTNTGFQDATILEFVPPQTEVLIFTGNHFPELPRNALGVWNNFSNLAMIDLSNNGIKNIPGQAFHKVSSVRRLILNHNDIYIVSSMSHPRVFSNFIHLEELHLTNAFTEQIVSQWYLLNLQDVFVSSSLKKLRKLHLEQNEIWKISNPDLFCPLEGLSELHLGDNQLTEINFTLSCLPKLRHLNVEFNKITTLAPSTLKILDEVFGDPEKGQSVNLLGNPLRCDCYLQKFFHWWKTTSVKISNKNDMRCFDGYPKYNAGLALTNVRKLDCEVQATTVHSTSSSHAVIRSLLTALIFLAGVIIMILLYTNRTRVMSGITPLLSNMKDSMQYTTIEKEELPTEVNV